MHPAWYRRLHLDRPQEALGGRYRGAPDVLRWRRRPSPDATQAPDRRWERDLPSPKGGGRARLRADEDGTRASAVTAAVSPGTMVSGRTPSDTVRPVTVSFCDGVTGGVEGSVGAWLGQKWLADFRAGYHGFGDDRFTVTGPGGTTVRVEPDIGVVPLRVGLSRFWGKVRVQYASIKG